MMASTKIWCHVDFFILLLTKSRVVHEVALLIAGALKKNTRSKLYTQIQGLGYFGVHESKDGLSLKTRI